MKKVIVVLAVMAVAAAVYAANTYYVGSVTDGEGTISISIYENDGVKTVRVFATDEHVINTVLLHLDSKQIDTLVDLLKDAQRKM